MYECVYTYIWYVYHDISHDMCICDMCIYDMCMYNICIHTHYMHIHMVYVYVCCMLYMCVQYVYILLIIHIDYFLWQSPQDTLKAVCKKDKVQH